MLATKLVRVSTKVAAMQRARSPQPQERAVECLRPVPNE